MAKPNSVRILEVYNVSPLMSNPPNSQSNFFLPLTSVDLLFLKTDHIEQVFLYPLNSDNPSFLDSIIIPKLKHSLSLTLRHFLPVSGNLVWPEDSPKPFILCIPNDSVSFTVSETDSNFNHLLSPNHEIHKSRLLIPTVQSSGTRLPLLAIQVTKFPNGDGFSIGISCTHVLFDAKSISLFLKAWTHICKLNNLENIESSSSSLPESLIPSFERGGFVLENPSSDFINDPKNIKYKSFNSNQVVSHNSSSMHGTFEITKAHIEKLRKMILEKSSTKEEEFHLSSFVVAYAYVLTCLVKAKQDQEKGDDDDEEEEEKKVFAVLLTADVRQLLNPPPSSNYFGNCIGGNVEYIEKRDFIIEDGFPNIAKEISDLILSLKIRYRSNSDSEFNNFIPTTPSESRSTIQRLSGIEIFLVTSSPKLKFYETDFGWGKPEKIEFVSMGNNNISLTEIRDGDGGIEVGLVLPNHQMNLFSSLFSNGLNSERNC